MPLKEPLKEPPKQVKGFLEGADPSLVAQAPTVKGGRLICADFRDAQIPSRLGLGCRVLGFFEGDLPNPFKLGLV